MPPPILIDQKSTLKPVDADSVLPLAQAVYESILDAILSGALASGAVLSEVQVGKLLHVSRTPVHDALKKLADDGLVEREANRRAVVAVFTSDDLFEIFEMRRLLERAAAEQAALRMDMRQLGPLRRAQDQMASSYGQQDWLARWVDYDDTFHHEIAVGCGNKRLQKDIDRYRLLHSAVNRMMPDTDVLSAAIVEHERILAALEAHDGAAAQQTMEAHIVTWQDYFVRNFPR